MYYTELIFVDRPSCTKHARWPATWAGRPSGRPTASTQLSSGGGRLDGRPWGLARSIERSTV